MTSTNRTSYGMDWLDTCDGEELQQRLGLYQVFLKLYEHHRGLLDEILSLENSGSKTLAGVTLPYVQGVVFGRQAYLVTNLLRGKTQALMQPQQTWVIGRDPRQVILPIQDKRLSRCHAALKYVENKGFHLIDLGSSNGSYVNGELIRHACLLKDGDRIRLGSLTVAFFLCQSAQTLRSLPAEIQRSLDNWQPLPTTYDRPGWQGLSSAEEPTEGDISIPNPLEETFTFMPPDR
ncbi:MAG: FHA domain-containing protein [Cyanobacteria bacterium CRU_2_1]|nr:FHA domain-containing protein [Cyanobacteria bacterium RU_5_0]NJR62877.1 FHA domain-containing protein [Cyanobacteria bacterium CRU_2_1]